MAALWGFDLGGTKIEGIIIDSETNQIISRLRIPTEGDKGYDHVIVQICKLITLLETESGLKDRNAIIKAIVSRNIFFIPISPVFTIPKTRCFHQKTN